MKSELCSRGWILLRSCFRTYGDLPRQNVNNGVRCYIQKLISQYESQGDRTMINFIGGKIPCTPRLAKLIDSYRTIEDNLNCLKDIAAGAKDDPDLENNVANELRSNISNAEKLEHEIVSSLVEDSEDFSSRNIVVEISAGVGGQESCLFARELFAMYCNYSTWKHWTYEVTDYSLTDGDGLRHGCLLISGLNCGKLLLLEGGIHRVQRVPVTEKSGRIHTSVASVAVLPELTDSEVVLNEKDLRIDTKTSSGPGGQHANRIESAVRICHIPTGISVECQDHRLQQKNKEIALKRLRIKLLKIEEDKRDNFIRGSRKSQVGSKSRNEKIRTYNYVQDRITDHRFKMTVHDIQRFLEGGEYLDNFLNELKKKSLQAKLEQFLDSLGTDDNKEDEHAGKRSA